MARGRNEQHRMARVRRGVRVGQGHGDIERAARIARARRPPFLAIEHPFVAVEAGVHRDIGRVGRRDPGLGHEIGRARAPFEQVGQPARLLFRRAVPLDDFHVAGVGGGAIEDFGGERRPAHLLGEIGVFDCSEAEALVGSGQPEIPQALGPRLGFELFANLDHPFGRLEAVALAPDIGVVLLFHGMISSRTIALTAAMSGRTLSVTPRSTCSSLDLVPAL